MKAKPIAYTITLDNQRYALREAREADAPAVLDHINRVVTESDYLTIAPGEYQSEMTTQKQAEIIKTSGAAPNRLMLLAMADDDLVALLHFRGGQRRRIRHVGEIGLSVKGSHWGRGIGRAMLEAMLSWARAGGLVKKVNLRVRSDNHGALHLYGAMGFTREGCLTRDIRIGDRFYDSIIMGLSID